MPAHSHSDNGHYHGFAGPVPYMGSGGWVSGVAAGGSGSGAFPVGTYGGIASLGNDNTAYASLANTGGGGAHNNMPPWCAVALIVKVLGTSINTGGALQGATGQRGAIWYIYNGVGTPAPGTFVGELDGDWCIRKTDGENFERVSGAWVDQGFTNRSTATITSGKLGRNTTGPSIAVNTWTKVLFDAQVFDASNNITDVANSRFVAPTAGYYEMSAAICQAVSAAGTYTYSILQTRVNGAAGGPPNSAAQPSQTSFPALENYVTAQATDTLKLNAGDVVELWYYSSQAGTYYSGSTTLTLTLRTAGPGPQGHRGRPGQAATCSAPTARTTRRPRWSWTRPSGRRGWADAASRSRRPCRCGGQVHGFMGLCYKTDGGYHTACLYLDPDTERSGRHLEHVSVRDAALAGADSGGALHRNVYRLAAGTTCTVQMKFGNSSGGPWAAYFGRASSLSTRRRGRNERGRLMPRYIVFTDVAPTDPPPDPLAVPAVLTEADDEAAAIQKVMDSHALGLVDELHACDLAATQDFDVTCDVSTAPKPPPSGERRIDSVDPVEGPAAGGIELTLHGAGFTNIGGVRFERGSEQGWAWSFTVIDDATMTATAPPMTKGAS